jgi:hypothetical protein
MQGGLTVFNIAGKPGHAEAVANETMTVLLQFAPQIRKTLCFDLDFNLGTVGKVSVLDSGQYTVPVQFTFVASFAWQLRQDLPPIRHVDVKLAYDI